MKYTVIGIYADNKQPWSHSVEEINPTRAAIKAIMDLYDEGRGGGELEEMFVVDVIEGEHMSVCPTGSGEILSLEDLKEIQEQDPQ